MSITSLLRVGTLATVAMGSLLASSSTQAQSPFFSFTPKGSYFLTSVTQWSPNMPNHYAVGVAQPVVMGKTGYRQYSAPEATVRGLTVAGLYVVKGVVIGYEIFGGASQAEADNSSGARMATSTVASSVTGNLGVMAFHHRGFSVFPLIGGGIGMYGVRYRMDGRAENLGARNEEHDDTYIYNLAPVGDAGLQIMFTTGHKGAVDANRFTLGLKGGYRQQFANGIFRGNADKLTGTPAPSAVAGPYVQLNLGVGLVR